MAEGQTSSAEGQPGVDTNIFVYKSKAEAARTGWQDARDRLEQARQAEVYCLDS